MLPTSTIRYLAMETRSSVPVTAIAASMMPALAMRKASSSPRPRGRFHRSMTPSQPTEPQPQSMGAIRSFG